METLSNDLFILLTHLSQINNIKTLTAIFIDGLNILFKPISFNWSDKIEPDFNKKVIEVRNALNQMGYIEIVGELSQDNYTIFQNAVQIFQVYSERIQQKEILESKEIDLEQTIKDSSIDLLDKNNRLLVLNEEYEALNEEYKVLNEQLIIKNEELQIQNAEVIKKQALLDTVNEIAKLAGCEIDININKVVWTNSIDDILEIENHEDLTLEKFFTFFIDEFKIQINKLVNNAIKTGEIFDKEMQILTAKGNAIWIRLLGFVEIKNNICVRFLGIFQNINDYKQTQMQLEESERIFHNFMEYSPIYVFFKDKDIRSLRLSKNYEKLLGKPMNELLGKNMFELFPSDLAKRMVADDIEVLNNNKEIVIEEEFNNHYYRTVKFPIKINGVPTYLAGYTIDITNNKLAEKTLKESEEKFRGLFDHLNAGIVIHALDSSIIMSNKVADSILGLTQDKIKGKKRDDEVWYFLDDNKNEISIDNYPVSKVLSTKRPIKNMVVGISNPNKDAITWVLVNGFPVFDATQKILEVVITFIDITERRLAIDELYKHREQLEKTVAERTLELENKNKELDKALKVFVGRELAIRKLENELLQLKAKK